MFLLHFGSKQGRKTGVLCLHGTSFFGCCASTVALWLLFRLFLGGSLFSYYIAVLPLPSAEQSLFCVFLETYRYLVKELAMVILALLGSLMRGELSGDRECLIGYDFGMSSWGCLGSGGPLTRIGMVALGSWLPGPTQSLA